MGAKALHRQYVPTTKDHTVDKKMHHRWLSWLKCKCACRRYSTCRSVLLFTFTNPPVASHEKSSSPGDPCAPPLALSSLNRVSGSLTSFGEVMRRYTPYERHIMNPPLPKSFFAMSTLYLVCGTHLSWNGTFFLPPMWWRLEKTRALVARQSLTKGGWASHNIPAPQSYGGRPWGVNSLYK